MKLLHIHRRNINRELAKIIKESIESDLPMDESKASAIVEHYNLGWRSTKGMHVNDMRETRFNFDIEDGQVRKVFLG